MNEIFTLEAEGVSVTGALVKLGAVGDAGAVTIQYQTCITVPFPFSAIALTFQVPRAALALV